MSIEYWPIIEQHCHGLTGDILAPLADFSFDDGLGWVVSLIFPILHLQICSSPELPLESTSKYDTHMGLFRLILSLWADESVLWIVTGLWSSSLIISLRCWFISVDLMTLGIPDRVHWMVCQKLCICFISRWDWLIINGSLSNQCLIHVAIIDL